MSHAKDRQAHDRPAPDRGESPKGQPRNDARDGAARDDVSRNAELLHAQDLLARTLRFLQHCAEDPLAALAAQNPRELIRELEALRDEPQASDEASRDEDRAGEIDTRETDAEPRTIPLRRRRSA